jgi:hypothetical protein
LKFYAHVWCAGVEIKEAFYSIMRPKVYPVCGQDAVSLSSFLGSKPSCCPLGHAA